jgi:hypothetical protein
MHSLRNHRKSASLPGKLRILSYAALMRDSSEGASQLRLFWQVAQGDNSVGRIGKIPVGVQWIELIGHSSPSLRFSVSTRKRLAVPPGNFCGKLFKE